MIVLDASALVDVVLTQSTAGWVLDRLADDEICAPVHQPAEVLSAVARLQRAGVIDTSAASAALSEAAALGQELVAISGAHLRRALQLGEGVRVLDGLYVALAEERSCPLVTTDRRLARSGAPCEVQAPPA